MREGRYRGDTDKEFCRARADPMAAGYPFLRNLQELRLSSADELPLEIHGDDSGRRARYIRTFRGALCVLKDESPRRCRQVRGLLRSNMVKLRPLAEPFFYFAVTDNARGKNHG